MKKLHKMFSVAAAAALALSMMILPAHGATAPATGTCEGTASVSPGLFFPGVGPSQDFSWSLSTECTVVSGDGVETLLLEATGTGTGFCGQSTAQGGEGTLTDPETGQTIDLWDIGWESAASVLLVSGSHNGPGTVTNSFQAQVMAQGGEDCAGSGATDFVVVIVAEFS